MMRALHTATTGLASQQLNMDVVANNLANVNTHGFKKARAEFQELLYQTLQVPGAETELGTQQPASLQVGLGVRPVSTQRMFTQGSLENTGNPLDLAIEGDGFFQIIRETGELAYSRSGAFNRDALGNVVTPEGLPLEPALSIPDDAVQITISRTGIVSALTGGSTTPVQLGQIELARFANPAGLVSLGANLYGPSSSSGDAIVGLPGESAFGTLAQEFLEGSNVNIAEELVDMIVGQRAYEINSKAVQTVDEMLQMANNMRR